MRNFFCFRFLFRFLFLILGSTGTILHAMEVRTRGAQAAASASDNQEVQEVLKGIIEGRRTPLRNWLSKANYDHTQLPKLLYCAVSHLSNPTTAPDEEGNTHPHTNPGRLSAKRVHWKRFWMLSQLVERFEDVPYHIDMQGLTVLHLAIQKDDPQILDMLLGKSKDPEVLSRGSETIPEQTPLEYAIGQQREMCVEVLLSHEADVVTRSWLQDGATPLLLAAKSGNCSNFKLLAGHQSADVFAKTKFNENLLHCAVAGGNENILGMLLAGLKEERARAVGRGVVAAGVSGTRERRAKDTVVKTVCERIGREEELTENEIRALQRVAHEKLPWGFRNLASVKVADAGNKLEGFFAQASQEVVQARINNRLRVDGGGEFDKSLLHQRTDVGYTPFHYALRNPESRHLIPFLLEADSQLVNESMPTEDGKGETPLMYAIKHANEQTVNHLLKNLKEQSLLY